MTKTQYLLKSYSLGQLQAGYTVKKPVKQIYTDWGGEQRERVVYREFKVAGCRIPASTIKKYAEGVIPGKAAQKKLDKMFRRSMYNSLRTSGANVREAGKKARSLEAIETVNKYKKYVAMIAKLNKVKKIMVVHGSMKSEMSMEDWDIYIREKIRSWEEQKKTKENRNRK